MTPGGRLLGWLTERAPLPPARQVMADESEITIDLTEADLEGCPSFLVAAAKSAAAEQGKPGGVHTITLSRSLVEPFLTFSPRRDLREKAWRLWTQRGQLDDARDNLEIAKEILLLRCEQAALHGYSTFAAYQTADTMAGAPERVMELLERVWEPACRSALNERTVLEACLAEELGQPDAAIEPWDWRYCAEKVRLQRFDFDETQLKPFLSLPAMQAAWLSRTSFRLVEFLPHSPLTNQLLLTRFRRPYLRPPSVSTGFASLRWTVSSCIILTWSSTKFVRQRRRTGRRSDWLRSFLQTTMRAPTSSRAHG